MKKREITPELREFLEATYTAPSPAGERSALDGRAPAEREQDQQQGNTDEPSRSAILLALKWAGKHPIRVAAALMLSVGIWFGTHRTHDPVALTSQVAVANCLDQIRKCALPDGGIRMAADGDPIWIQPYAANYAALALLSTNDPADRKLVRQWLSWYASMQNTNGGISNYENKMTQLNHGKYKDLGEIGSSTSTAALFLLVAARYHEAAGDGPPEFKEAAAKAFGRLKSAVAADGLFWDSPSYRIKYLVSNLEAYGGLHEAIRYFDSMGDKKASETARTLLNGLSGGLGKFYVEDKAIYAFAIDQLDNQATRPSDAELLLQTDGVANLSALAWISRDRKGPWQHLKQYKVEDRKISSPEKERETPAPVERWYVAAIHAGDAREVAGWRDRTLRAAAGFTQLNAYVDRPAFAALAIQQGSDWMPNVAQQGPPVQTVSRQSKKPDATQLITYVPR